MYWVIVYRTIVLYTLCVEEKIGDVLRGLGEDRGWTSKPDRYWEEIGDELRRQSSYACLEK